jgi:acetyl-CoA synthetase
LKQEIADLLRETIGPVAVPDAIYFVDSIPKTRSGKIMRRVLKAVASGNDVGDLTTLENEASVEEIRNALESLRHPAATAPADDPH